MHMRSHPGAAGISANDLPDLAESAFSMFEVVTITKGSVTLRGCEFNGGFLVIGAEQVFFFPTLTAALRNAEHPEEVPPRPNGEIRTDAAAAEPLFQ